MEMYMSDLLMSNLAIVLQQIVILCSSSLDEFLQDRLEWNSVSSIFCVEMRGRGGRTRISVSESSGISVNFSPWCLGMTSYFNSMLDIAG